MTCGRVSGLRRPRNSPRSSTMRRYRGDDRRARMDRLVTTLADRPWQLLALFCGVLGPLWIFGALAEGVWDRAGFAWDVLLLRTIHGYATPSRDAVMIATPS